MKDDNFSDIIDIKVWEDSFHFEFAALFHRFKVNVPLSP